MTLVLGSGGDVKFVHEGLLPDAVAILDKHLGVLKSTN
jgi:hypothetical protein